MENKKGAVSSCFEGAGKRTCCFSLRLNSSIARDDKSRRGDWGWFSPNYSSMPSLEQEWICFPKLRKEKTAQSLRWVMFSIERPGWNMEELWAGWLLAERTVYGGRYLGHGRRVNKYLMYPSEPQERIGHFSFPQWGFEKLELQMHFFQRETPAEFLSHSVGDLPGPVLHWPHNSKTTSDYFDPTNLEFQQSASLAPSARNKLRLPHCQRSILLLQYLQLGEIKKGRIVLLSPRIHFSLLHQNGQLHVEDSNIWKTDPDPKPNPNLAGRHVGRKEKCSRSSPGHAWGRSISCLFGLLWCRAGPKCSLYVERYGWISFH